MTREKLTIAFQGALGAYSHQACAEAYPNADAIPFHSFEDALNAVKDGNADLAMMPVQNSTYGRVPDIHRLLPQSGLKIIGEHYVRVRISLMAQKGVPLAQVKTALSHPVLLGQCAAFLNKHGIKPIKGGDTAGSAEDVSKSDDPSQGALASEFAANLYGLDVLARDIEDASNNTTRFLIVSRDYQLPALNGEEMKTTFVFRVRNIPAALYKAMGGFATNGVNMVKLESAMVDGSFTATQFYADIIGHPDEPAVARALEELEYFTTHLEILGVYKSKHPG
ncbi:prephenate dehydratase [Amylibacter kogurei]|uniref:prephenate dehydratase n=1 Tax=Paramylibacter kogurei TaxID=1889778 RepID=A0A2G5K930_9RHOB|nr:prephenate dehydratase [Amylibacter kogurei]PIB26048.1 prephenate dehydratase [Amylibacter kogurei]